jgi:hypothetical protein
MVENRFDFMNDWLLTVRLLPVPLGVYPCELLRQEPRP